MLMGLSSQKTLFSVLATIFFCVAVAECGNVYKIGVGIADITGPAAEINMMGYAQLGQRTAGIHLRQFSRAFVVDDGKSRILFISIDAGMTSQVIYLEVVKALKEKYGSLYSEKNVCISSTHTHSGPGGFLQHFKECRDGAWKHTALATFFGMKAISTTPASTEVPLPTSIIQQRRELTMQLMWIRRCSF
ncbi:neutral ceramidase [Caerostris darwini]|uniref:Neutral ceramidase n=1 Tax=Caerostris darwini TaxID=1538125 RepID=A0AAV4PZM6_9ARAC|nr:neutral ceramidase [Caerostris darwini]